MTKHRLSWVALALVAVATVAVVSQRVTAQQLPTTVQPGTAAIWTDKSEYNIGDPIQYCYRIPIVGQVTINDLAADGSSTIIFNQVVNSTHGCLNGVVTPPSGHECLSMNYPLFGGTGRTQTCFNVLGSTPPRSALAIYTDKQTYRIGEGIDVCYRVPAPGPIRIIDQIAEDTPTTFFSGYDDGTGGCIPGTITPPGGNECLTIVFTYTADGGTATARTCFFSSP